MTMTRSLSRLLLAVMFAVLVMRLVGFLGNSEQALRWPFELDYGEGIVWQQAKMMFTPAAFGPIDGFPTIVFHYTPLFHAATLALSAATGMDMLIAGRTVSIGSTLLSALVIGLIVLQAAPKGIDRAARWIAAAAGGLIVFCLYPVLFWAQLMRVDMLAFLLSLLGIWAGVKAVKHPAWIYIAALCFVAAVFTKQTSITAPAALFGVLLWVRPRTAFAGIATCIVIGLATLGVLQWATDGGFIRHVFLYNIKRFEWDRMNAIITTIGVHGPLFGVVLIMAGRRIAELRGRLSGGSRGALAESRADFAFVTVLAYALTSSLMLVSIAKSGSSVNYLIEWLFVMAILGGIGLYDAAQFAVAKGAIEAPRDARFVLAVLGVPLALAANAWLIKPESFDVFWNKARVPQLVALSARVKAADKPIIADDMVMLLRSGKDVVWEPAIFAELASKGVWDEKPFVARIRRGEFAMFITVGKRGQKLFDSRYNPAVADAMDAAYPVKEILAGYTLHLPRS